ncbi:class I SAM-dependent methyltransferase [Maribacter halichondriae]|uniref:class I SAM-dependent methyltransferase n=1 Tax=Maribacter halichondriae TaxID=2980554 RepID=UPI002358A633|nr:class I SAM-dependent methyltransferase [Maribacter sp. Hal144]
MRIHPHTLSIILFLFGAFISFAQYAKEDWEDRDTWMKVDQLFKLAEVGEGDKVADIGCHEGYLSFHISKQVGSNGKVFSVDVQEYRLEDLNEYIKERKVSNIEVILGDYDDPKLPEGLLDVVFIVDTYHEMDDYMKILAHVRKALKSDGIVLILEKLKDPHKGKSRDAQASSHTLASKYVRQELEEAGFKITKEINDFGIWNHEPEKNMWILVAEKNKN